METDNRELGISRLPANGSRAQARHRRWSVHATGSRHTGVALWLDGALHLMHAPLVGSVVEISAQPLADRILRIEGQDGIMVARPR